MIFFRQAVFFRQGNIYIIQDTCYSLIKVLTKDILPHFLVAHLIILSSQELKKRKKKRRNLLGKPDLKLKLLILDFLL
jgi:hypothetical protein